MSFPFLLHALLVLLPLICECFVLSMTLLPWWLVLSMMSGNLVHIIVGIFEMHNIKSVQPW
jgi:hypothetical protein